MINVFESRATALEEVQKLIEARHITQSDFGAYIETAPEAMHINFETVRVAKLHAKAIPLPTARTRQGKIP